MDQALPGEEVRVAAGTCVENITIDRRLTLQGAGAGGAIVDGNAADRVITVTNGVSVTIQGMTIQNGFNIGGGIYNRGGKLIVSNCIISGNNGIFGGGILNAGWLTVTNSTISGNGDVIVAFGGGICDFGAVIVVANSTISGNAAFVDGGAIFSSGWLTVTNNNADADETGDGSGGGIFLSGGNARLDNNVIADNQAGDDGYGSGVYVGEGTAHLRHNTIARNTGGDGSGVHVTLTSTVALTNNILVSHTVGITVANDSTATLESTLWATDTAWQNGTPWVNNGFLTHNNGYPGDPDFVDPDNGDYHIGSRSAAIDKGPDAGVPQDKDGVARPQGAGFDLGAYEVQGPSVGGYTEPLQALLWPWLALAAAVVMGASAVVALKQRAA